MASNDGTADGYRRRSHVIAARSPAAAVPASGPVSGRSGLRVPSSALTRALLERGAARLSRIERSQTLGRPSHGRRRKKYHRGGSAHDGDRTPQRPSGSTASTVARAVPFHVRVEKRALASSQLGHIPASGEPRSRCTGSPQVLGDRARGVSRPAATRARSPILVELDCRASRGTRAGDGRGHESRSLRQASIR